MLLRVLSGGIRQFASPGWTDYNGWPSYRMASGEILPLEIDYAGWLGGEAIDTSVWSGDGVEVADPGVSGALTRVDVTAPADWSRALITNTVTTDAGRRHVLTVRIYGGVG